MHFDMPFQLVTKSKSLHTKRTFKWFSPSVASHVSVMHMVQEMTSHIENSCKVSFFEDEL